jgi:hypothetical protein
VNNIIREIPMSAKASVQMTQVEFTVMILTQGHIFLSVGIIGPDPDRYIPSAAFTRSGK